ncbi:MAG: CHAT domain-containing protein [Bacteroidales bacterium]|nr:CHAT domain-containing protein [Bacteroidales bacterium]
MTFFKSQFNSLVSKTLILLLTGVSLSLPKVNAQKTKDTSYASRLFDSSKIYYATGEYNKTTWILNRILQLKSEISVDTPPEYFRIYNLLGASYRNLGESSIAIDFYQKALRRTSDIFNQSVINGNIASIYSLRGDYTKAISYYKNSLSVLEKSNDKRKYRHIADNYHNQGFSYLNFGDYNHARICFLKSIGFAEKNRLGGEGETYFNCGLTYKRMDSLDKADYCFRKAIACNIREFGENHYMTGMSYMNYATFNSKMGRFSESDQLYKKAYTILINTLGDKHLYTFLCLKDNGERYYQTGNYLLALKYYQKSLISKIYNFNDSSVYANPKADILPDIDLLDILKLKAQAFTKLAENENRTENLRAALATLELAATFTEQLRTGYLYESSKLQLTTKEHEIYLSLVCVANSLYEISGDLTYAGLAFRYAEYSKYGVLRELKNEALAKGVAGIPDSIIDNERRIESQISGTRMQIEDENKREHPSKEKIEKLNMQQFALTQKLERLEQRLESKYPDYYRQKYSNQVVSLPQLQGAMSRKEAILEYVLENNDLYTFTITRDTFLMIKQVADSTFLANLNFFNAALHSEYSSNYVAYRNASYNLYKKLIRPAEPLLKNKNLLVIPGGMLSLIPFDVLIDKPYKDSDKCDYRKESYLLRKYPIGYAYSATLYYSSINIKGKRSPDFLGIAPDYKNSKDSLRSIPLGLKSVRRIALLTLGKSLTGSEATEANFKKYCGKYDIIHFYAHGFEDTLNPVNSMLFLSHQADSMDDGYLHAWEINSMQLNAELVVLASCNSGSGKLSKGEGTLSISRSFMYAGSQSVVMSLWRAYDRSTIGMLNNFYQNLLKGMRKDEALRLAKLDYLEKANPVLAHPRFWAGIVVNGNQNGIYHYWFLKKVVLVIFIILTILFGFKKRKTIRSFPHKAKKQGRILALQVLSGLSTLRTQVLHKIRRTYQRVVCKLSRLLSPKYKIYRKRTIDSTNI